MLRYRLQSVCALLAWIGISSILSASSNALYQSSFDGVYGGMGRHLSKAGRYTMDLTGATLGAFIGDNIKLGFTTMTFTGLLSDRREDGIWDSLERTRKRLGNKTPTALPPADFTYSSIMASAEYVGSSPIFITWSAYADLGYSLISRSKSSNSSELDIYSIDQADVPIAEIGVRIVIKLLTHLHINLGYGYRKDLGKGLVKNRPSGFANLDAFAFTNAFYMIMQ